MKSFPSLFLGEREIHQKFYQEHSLVILESIRFDEFFTLVSSQFWFETENSPKYEQNLIVSKLTTSVEAIDLLSSFFNYKDFRAANGVCGGRNLLQSRSANRWCARLCGERGLVQVVHQVSATTKSTCEKCRQQLLISSPWFFTVSC